MEKFEKGVEDGVPSVLSDGLRRIFTTEKEMANFEVEKLAVEYCAKHGIDLYDPVREQVLTAFCIGAKIEREACIKQAKAEAFERAAAACDCMADGWENNPGNNPMAGYVASSNCAAAIREMAKENGK